MQQAKHNDEFRFPEHSFINAVHLPFTNSMVLYFLCLVWIIYEQVMIAALDCSRDDLAMVRRSSHPPDQGHNT